jgi:hypothetical protein
MKGDSLTPRDAPPVLSIEQLVALRDRLAKATGPERFLDAWLDSELVQTDGETPPYTASLDAAVTLVPEDMTWSLDWEAKDRPDRRATAELYPEGREIVSEAATPALALCLVRINYEVEVSGMSAFPNCKRCGRFVTMTKPYAPRRHVSPRREAKRNDIPLTNYPW